MSKKIKYFIQIDTGSGSFSYQSDLIRISKKAFEFEYDNCIRLLESSNHTTTNCIRDHLNLSRTIEIKDYYDYVKKALTSGLHVLCEKPLCLQKSQAKELCALAKEKGLVLMEAIKTAYSPGFIRLISMVKSGVIGEVVDVETCFTRITPSAMRELQDEQFGGSLTEFGSYTLLPIVKILGTKYDDISFESFFAENGLDIYTKVHFKYRHALATSKTGLKVKSDGQLLISGTNGYIKVTPPWWKTTECHLG